MHNVYAMNLCLEKVVNNYQKLQRWPISSGKLITQRSVVNDGRSSETWLLNTQFTIQKLI